jgi:hypothetical protein
MMYPHPVSSPTEGQLTVGVGVGEAPAGAESAKAGRAMALIAITAMPTLTQRRVSNVTNRMRIPPRGNTAHVWQVPGAANYLQSSARSTFLSLNY